MSRIEELEDEIKGLENRKIELLKELEVEKQKTKIEYPPLKMNENYWFINQVGCVFSSRWIEDGFDTRRCKIGNIFLTEDEAKKERDRRILLTRFRQFRDRCNGDWKPDWKDKVKAKYFIVFNHESSELLLKWYIDVQPFESFGCFKNREDAIRAIELFGDEIKRLYLEG
nr:MAG TPA: hypothetical protein [Caudoviricetes sp.]